MHATCSMHTGATARTLLRTCAKRTSSPTGKWLVTVDDEGQLRILDPDGLEQVMTSALGARAVTMTSPDGRWLAAMGRQALLVVDAGTLTPHASDRPDFRYGLAETPFRPELTLSACAGCRTALGARHRAGALDHPFDGQRKHGVEESLQRRRTLAGADIAQRHGIIPHRHLGGLADHRRRRTGHAQS